VTCSHTPGSRFGSRVPRSIRYRKPTRIIGVHLCPGPACLSIVPRAGRYYSNYQEVLVKAVRKSGCLNASLVSLRRGTNWSTVPGEGRRVSDLIWRSSSITYDYLWERCHVCDRVRNQTQLIAISSIRFAASTFYACKVTHGLLIPNAVSTRIRPSEIDPGRNLDQATSSLPKSNHCLQAHCRHQEKLKCGICPA
jgi:hypothetical protein